MAPSNLQLLGYVGVGSEPADDLSMGVLHR
jgi:hypothetical protein